MLFQCRLCFHVFIRVIIYMAYCILLLATLGQEKVGPINIDQEKGGPINIRKNKILLSFQKPKEEFIYRMLGCITSSKRISFRIKIFISHPQSNAKVSGQLKRRYTPHQHRHSTTNPFSTAWDSTEDAAMWFSDPVLNQVFFFSSTR